MQYVQKQGRNSGICNRRNEAQLRQAPLVAQQIDKGAVCEWELPPQVLVKQASWNYVAIEPCVERLVHERQLLFARRLVDY